MIFCTYLGKRDRSPLSNFIKKYFTNPTFPSTECGNVKITLLFPAQIINPHKVSIKLRNFYVVLQSVELDAIITLKGRIGEIRGE